MEGNKSTSNIFAFSVRNQTGGKLHIIEVGYLLLLLITNAKYIGNLV